MPSSPAGGSADGRRHGESGGSNVASRRPSGGRSLSIHRRSDHVTMRAWRFSNWGTVGVPSGLLYGLAAATHSVRSRT
jgi:hypothetical protein